MFTFFWEEGKFIGNIRVKKQEKTLLFRFLLEL